MKPGPATQSQRDLFTRRFKKVPGLDPAETQLQISLVAQLRWRARNDVVYFHCPNGEERDKRTAAKLKAMGVLPGVSDLTFEWMDEGRLRVLHLELKSKGGRRTDPQVEFCVAVRAAGAHYEVADTIDDALAILQRYRLLKR